MKSGGDQAEVCLTLHELLHVTFKLRNKSIVKILGEFYARVLLIRLR
jgi:hypothetical protein